MQQECLLEEPVEFWGGVMLLHSLNRFFDRVLYFTLVGYQKAGRNELAASMAWHTGRSMRMVVQQHGVVLGLLLVSFHGSERPLQL